MKIENKARAFACALVGGAVLGSGVGLALGAAYWAGCRAQQLALASGKLHVQPASAAAVDTPSGLRGASFTSASSVMAHAVTPVFAQASAQPATADSRERDCLADAIYYEARGEGRAGEAAVAQVVMNRLHHPAFPKSVCGVVFQKDAESDGCQFSFVCDGSMRRPREAGAWRQAEQIAARALQGVVAPAVGNATHFHVVGLQPDWGPRLLRVAQVGLHVFYRFGRPSAAAMMTARAANADLEAPAASARPSAQYILASAITNAVAAPADAATPPSSAAAVAPALSEAPATGAGRAPAPKSDAAGPKA